MPEKEKRKNKKPDMARIKKLHFIGIGGCGMSAIAKILLKKGYLVSGSDVRENANTIRLRDMGAQIFIGHEPTNVRSSQLTVVSTAIPKSNPEVDESRSLGIPIIKRAEMLSWIMDQFNVRVAVAGTHGKTTTTSMIANVLTRCEKDPTFLIGGEANDVDGNARLGTGEFVVAEADESDGSFLTLHPTLAVITNIECDHMEYYGTYSNVIDTFNKFASIVPDDGTIILGGDGKGSDEILRRNPDKKILTYGLSKDKEYWADNIHFSERRSKFDVYRKDIKLGEFTLCVPGKQNIDNALAVIAASTVMGCNISCIASGLQLFTGAKRRFTIVGIVNDIIVVDDYGHHPTEVVKTLEAAKLGYPGRRVICIFQPHRYTRTSHLFAEFGKAFKDADVTLITDIYSAGESPIVGISGKTVFEEIKKNGADVTYIKKKELIPDHVLDIARPNDIIITMGAGDITNLSKEIYNRLRGKYG